MICQVYKLFQGKTVVFIGITHNMTRKRSSHKAYGHIFDRMIAIESFFYRHNARAKEASELEQFRHSHDGENPLYNRE